MTPGLPPPSFTSPDPDGEGGLRRQLGLADVVAIHVGNILGSGIFVAPAAVALALSGARGSLLWLGGGLIAACGAMVYAECGARLPRSGGFYVCYRIVYGEAVAFVGGWAALLITYPASIAAIALIFGSYLGEIVPALADARSLTAAAAILVVAVINASGVRRAAWTQRILTAAKISALAAVCVAAILVADPADIADSPGSPRVSEPAASWSILLGALVVILWTYDGWSDINMVAGEVRDPRRVLGRAVLVGTSVLVVVYSLVQVAVGRLLPPHAAAASDRVLAEAVEAGLGGGSGKAVALLVVLATFGSVHGIVLAASRLGWAMARDGVYFKFFGRVSPVRGTPARAIFALAATSSVYLFAAGFRNLLALFSFTVWIFYSLTAVGLIILRRRGIGETARGRLSASMAVPAIVILTGTAMSAGLFVENPGRSLAGLALLAAGFPVHALWRRFRDRGASTDLPSRA